jgi:hypothetical protein
MRRYGVGCFDLTDNYHTQRDLFRALKGHHTIAQGKRQRRPGKRPTPHSSTLKGLHKLGTCSAYRWFGQSRLGKIRVLEDA